MELRVLMLPLMLQIKDLLYIKKLLQTFTISREKSSTMFYDLESEPVFVCEEFVKHNKITGKNLVKARYKSQKLKQRTVNAEKLDRYTKAKRTSNTQHEDSGEIDNLVISIQL